MITLTILVLKSKSGQILTQVASPHETLLQVGTWLGAYQVIEVFDHTTFYRGESL